MALLDLLKNPNAYRPGVGSKSFKFGQFDPTQNGPLLGERVTFNVADNKANPTFVYGSNHSNPNSEDVFARGGINTSLDRRKTDVNRITEFFKTPIGKQFIAKQVILQSQNKFPPKIYNLGINTLEQVAATGLANVKKGGALSIGGIDIAETLGAEVNYITLKEFKGIGVFDGVRGGLLREVNYGLGSPGKNDSKDILNNSLRKITGGIVNPLPYDHESSIKVDQVNALPIFQKGDNTSETNFENKSKDFIKFQFEVKTQSGGNHIIAFRAFLDSLSDDFNASHNEYKYNGRGEPFYIYNKFDRKIRLSFKIAAQTRSEMKPLYQKINYLAAQTAPNYSETLGRIRTPFMYLTVGDWFNRIPGFVSNVSLAWQKHYPWEIALDKQTIDGKTEGKDAEMLVLPHVLDVNLNYQPIHNFVPNNRPDTPFIGINKGKWHLNAPTKTISEPVNDSNFWNKLLHQF